MTLLEELNTLTTLKDINSWMDKVYSTEFIGDFPKYSKAALSRVRLLYLRKKSAKSAKRKSKPRFITTKSGNLLLIRSKATRKRRVSKIS